MPSPSRAFDLSIPADPVSLPVEPGERTHVRECLEGFATPLVAVSSTKIEVCNGGLFVPIADTLTGWLSYIFSAYQRYALPLGHDPHA
jgi:hypothetical protein